MLLWNKNIPTNTIKIYGTNTILVNPFNRVVFDFKFVAVVDLDHALLYNPNKIGHVHIVHT